MTTILTVGYPLAAITPDAAGGAEQVLRMVEAAAVAAGLRSIVIAPRGSAVAGELLPIGAVPATLDQRAIAIAREEARAAVRRVLDREPVDLIHMHGIDFDAYLPPAGVPVIVTLHGPATWYARSALEPDRPGTSLVAVSEAQRRTLPHDAPIRATIENGIELSNYGGNFRNRGYALVLSRIAPEKGVADALRAAHEADAALLVAGALYGYPDHQRYWRDEIAPLLDKRRRYLGPVGGRNKRRLLAAAACVLIPSQIPETSSLVVREAFASGTPVIAYRNDALARVIEPGRTGLLVDDVHQLAQALGRTATLDRAACRAVAQHRFDATRMTRSYLHLYQMQIENARRSVPA